MISKKELLRRLILCVILDRDHLPGKKMFSVAKKALAGGADMIQLRDKRSSGAGMLKTARSLKRLAGRYRRIFIVNDRVDIAAAVDADGAHIGAGDLSLPLARKLLGPDKIIGVSTRNAAEARLAERLGADYAGLGPVFATPVKRAKKAIGLKACKEARNLKIPVFAIGGVNTKNAGKLAAAGAKRAAVIRAVCASGGPQAATRRLKAILAS